VRLDGRVAFRRVLNDVLLTHLVPAATTRYELLVGGHREVHRSSGLWIATPAGSTAAIRSAGGRVLKVEAKRLQYRVRELYREPGRTYRLVGGVLPEGGAIEVTSRMPEGRLYADGARRVRRFPFGSRAVFTLGREPLRLIRPRA
jgi:NAD+ kinase